jgi:hypothetical protein
MSSIYGSIYRFLLGTYINQSARTVVEKTSQKVQYEVFDQYKQKYIRKLGNRYTYRYKIFDVTTTEERTNLLSLLLSLNGTRQTFQPFYDTDYSASVYCDVIFNELTYFPQSFMDLTLTFVDVDTNPTIAPNMITVTAPNGGESYAIGEDVNITWSSYNITGNVDIELWKGGVFYDTIVSDTANDGLYAWTIDTTYSAGADFQIKIRDTNTGLLSGFSDANFTIYYDGYYLPDGSNDYLNNTHALTWGNAYTIAFSLKHPTGTILKGYPNYGGIYSFAYSYLDCYDYGNATLRAGDQSGNITDLSLPNGTFAVDNTEHKYIAIVNKITGYIAFYKDGNLVAEANRTVYIPTIPKEFLFGKYIGYINTAQVKNILITSHQFSATDITNYGSGNITAIDNKVLWYKCNEADTGAPYTDKALDSSGNGNHGTPTNITGATFFNHTFHWIYEWLNLESLSPDNPYGKMAYLTYEQELNISSNFEYEVENAIDYEGLSITGKLHRRYVADADGNIVQNIKFLYKCYNLEEADYNNMILFDGKEIKFYPDSDASDYYTAFCSIVFLNMNEFIHSDYAEIEIVPRGILTT